MRGKLPIIFLAILLAAFVFGLLQLFKLRFESGDVYPEYSSLRTDPLGTRAFYESLELMPGISARRDLSTANRLPDGKETAYLHLAARAGDWDELPEEIFKEINAFLARGGRLVISFFPETQDPSRNVLNRLQKTEKKKERPTKPGKKQKQPEDEMEGLLRLTSVKKRWGVEVAFVELAQNAQGVYQSVLARKQAESRSASSGAGFQPDAGPSSPGFSAGKMPAATGWKPAPLPASISWHSGTVFTNLNKAWQIIYSRDTHPVIVERKFGPGSVVLASDSYFLSNQAMREERHAGLLAWFVGSSKHVVFDEAHLGVTEEPGVATLMRKYRLHGLVAGFLVLAGLLIWKNSMSLVPPHDEELPEAHVAGKDSAAGFVNLLRRNLASSEVLNVCLAEWKKSSGAEAKLSSARQQRIQAVVEAENALPRKERDPVKAYQAVCRILKDRSEFRVPSSESQRTTEERKVYG